ncbi:hypothetical protein ACGFXC_19090 [Streptomyces sp. NPDC048507]|uniref:hypothetical protein n=1 Tax=Streptomyces sp. NPDC048507 TaxID=3365560 RepID=UPI0037122E66
MTTDPTSTAHQAGLGYDESPLGEIEDTGFSVSPDGDGAGVTVRGTCPRCGGPTSTTYRYGVPGLGGKGLGDWFAGTRARPGAPDRDPLYSEAHFCECGHAHPGMPAEAVFVGCGAAWRIRSAP